MGGCNKYTSVEIKFLKCKKIEKSFTLYFCHCENISFSLCLTSFYPVVSGVEVVIVPAHIQ